MKLICRSLCVLFFLSSVSLAEIRLNLKDKAELPLTQDQVDRLAAVSQTFKDDIKALKGEQVVQLPDISKRVMLAVIGSLQFKNDPVKLKNIIKQFGENAETNELFTAARLLDIAYLLDAAKQILNDEKQINVRLAANDLYLIPMSDRKLFQELVVELPTLADMLDSLGIERNLFQEELTFSKKLNPIYIPGITRHQFELLWHGFIAYRQNNLENYFKKLSMAGVIELLNTLDYLGDSKFFMAAIELTEKILLQSDMLEDFDKLAPEFEQSLRAQVLGLLQERLRKSFFDQIKPMFLYNRSLAKDFVWNDVAFSDDASSLEKNLIAYVGSWGVVKTLDLLTGETNILIPAGQQKFIGFAFRPQSTDLLVTDLSWVIELWDTKKLSRKPFMVNLNKFLRGNHITYPFWSSDGKKLRSLDLQEDVLIEWDIEKGVNAYQKENFAFGTRTMPVFRRSKDGNYFIVTFDRYGHDEMQIWDLQQRKKVGTITKVVGMEIQQVGKDTMLALHNKKLQIWDLATATLKAEYPFVNTSVSIFFGDNPNEVFVFDKDKKTLSTLDLKTGVESLFFNGKSLSHEEKTLFNIMMSQGRNYFAWTEDGKLHVIFLPHYADYKNLTLEQILFCAYIADQIKQKNEVNIVHLDVKLKKIFDELPVRVKKYLRILTKNR